MFYMCWIDYINKGLAFINSEWAGMYEVCWLTHGCVEGHVSGVLAILGCVDVHV